jgi:hypothetical protein
MEELLVDDARSPTGPPLVVVLLGPAGSGKTTRGVPMAKERHKVGFVSVNADTVKERLPEYRGWNASALHEESSAVAKELRDVATAQRMNIIYDITGTNFDSVRIGVTHFADFGYRVFVLLLDLEPWRASHRAWERFQSNPFGVDGTCPPGRYVPPGLVYNGMGHKPRETFSRIKNHPGVTGYCHVDAATPLGTEPRILERSVW